MGDQDSIYDSSSKKASIIIGLKKEGLLSMCAFVWVDLKTIRLTLYFGYLYMPNQFDQKPYTSLENFGQFDTFKCIGSVFRSTHVSTRIP